MYGGSGKLGRGGGGGGRGTKRNPPSLPPAPRHRPVGGGAAGGRLSFGGAGDRNRLAGTDHAAAPSAPDETFSLVTEDPLAFAMIIRLAPNLVDEIRRVEAQGGTARIKFDSNANNAAGNVIDVGGKDFRFTWSREPGDLCDIYEERKSGDDGNGLLVESGCAWRKLNVQRILDKSTMNHVKMRSEEAERKLKSRKAIILDHENPSVKCQMKTLAAAAVDVNPRRMPFKPKKEPAFTKQRFEPTQVSSAKSSVKLGSSSTTTSKGRLSVSPLPSPPGPSGAMASMLGIGTLTRAHTSLEEVITPQVISKEGIANTKKEMPIGAVHATVREASAHGAGLGATPMDLQSMLITLLMKNPKGMSLKALEKATGDTIPNSARKIEPIIKRIATFQAPGRYFLKSSVELDSLKKPSSESGSSPEFNRDQTPVPEPTFLDKAATEGFEQQAQLSSKLGEESNLVKKIDVQQNYFDLFGDKRVSNNSEGQAGSSSESGSGSDSESDSSDSASDSGSQSRSRSKSRSPAGSGSGSSSDSESDGSSSSKEGSDVDVDIMTSDDDKEEAEHKLQPPELRLSTSPIPLRTDVGPEPYGIDEGKQDDQVSDAIEIDKDLANDDHENDLVEITDLVPKNAESRLLETIPFSPALDKQRESQQMSRLENFVIKKKNMVKDVLGHEQSDISKRISKSKLKRDHHLKHFDEKPDSAKRLKAGMSVQPPISGRSRDAVFSEIPHYLSPDRLNQDPYEDHAAQLNDRVGRDGNAESGSQKGHNLAMPGQSISDAHHSGQRSLNVSAWGKALDMTERPSNHVENLGQGIKQSERNYVFPDGSDGSAFRSTHAHEEFSFPRDKVHREMRDEYNCAYEKSLNKNVRVGGNGDNASMLPNAHYRNNVEQVGKFKDAGQMTHSFMGPFPMDNNRSDDDKSPVVNGKGSLLRRELSDLELGELREPLPGEETQGVKKQIEKKSSFKILENKPNALDNWNSDLRKGRTAGKAIQDSRKLQSPPNLKVAVPSNLGGPFRKSAPEDDIEDSIRPQQKVVLSQAQQFSGIDCVNTEVGSQLNKLGDVGGKFRKNEEYTSQEVCLEGYGGTHKKISVGVPQQHETKYTGQTLVPNMIRETKVQKPNTVTDVTDRREDTFWMDSNSCGWKRESSSDEDNFSHSMYDKDEPELKGPIKDFSQYKEYVQEYCEKYGSYCSLNKSLETYRNDFHKLGCDLELAKVGDTDGYYSILGQLKERFRQCGMRHKRQKKIFVVLHEELKHLKQRIKDYAQAYTRD